MYPQLWAAGLVQLSEVSFTRMHKDLILRLVYCSVTREYCIQMYIFYVVLSGQCYQKYLIWLRTEFHKSCRNIVNILHIMY
jgi:hypothetical protein